MEDRIVELLGAGVKPGVVAASVGCDPSYVSQLLEREDVLAKVQDLRAQRAAELIGKDNDINDIEQLALNRIKTLLPMQTNLALVTKVFTAMNGARKSTDVGLAQQGAQPGAIVSLNLPAAAEVFLKVTTDNQVVEIAGRSMVPLASSQVSAKLREKQALRLLEASKPKELAPPATPAVSAKTKSIVDQL